MKMLIKNANIITPYEIAKDSSLAIKDGKIEKIFHREKVNENEFDEIIDAEGKYLSPGFIDIHNHGNFGHDAMEGNYEALDGMANFHIKNGVTSYLATTMTAKVEDIKKALEVAGEYINDGSNYSNVKAQVLGVYLEGPYFSMEKKGAQPPEYIKNPDLDEVKEFIKISKNTIKVVAVAPELEGAEEFIRYLKNEGIAVAAGHSNATFDEAKKGIDAGVSIATHLYNGMRAFSHREPGIIGAVLTDERVACEMICDGIHLNPGAMDLAVKAKGKDGIILMSDAMMATGLKEGKYELGGQAVYVKDGAARLKEGNLAGSTLTLNKSVYNMVNMVGVKLEDAIRMATLNPAKAIGVDNEKGSIEVGKDADLIIFDENINISKAIVKGKIRQLTI